MRQRLLRPAEAELEQTDGRPNLLADDREPVTLRQSRGLRGVSATRLAVAAGCFDSREVAEDLHDLDRLVELAGEGKSLGRGRLRSLPAARADAVPADLCQGAHEPVWAGAARDLDGPGGHADSPAGPVEHPEHDRLERRRPQRVPVRDVAEL